MTPSVSSLGVVLSVALVSTIVGCSDSTPTGDALGPTDQLVCTIPQEFFTDSGLGRGGIPSLQNPEFVTAEPNRQNAYLAAEDRVIGLILDGQPVAVPHNILWYHEIVNLDRGNDAVAVTYCPVTGSSLVFDRASIGGQELGVSGLLFKNNLIMHNRGSPESLFPQMLGEARCKADIGRTLARYPAYEMTWQAWKDLYPGTTVVSSDANISRNYRLNPYDAYEKEDAYLYSAMPPIDPRRPPKERVLGLPAMESGESGIAFPFGTLEDDPGSWAAVEVDWDGETVVVLWADVLAGAGVFRPFDPATGERLEFRVTAVDGIEDIATGSRWSVTGKAIGGPLLGTQLTPVAQSFVAFWGAWAAFNPDTRLWTGS